MTVTVETYIKEAECLFALASGTQGVRRTAILGQIDNAIQSIVDHAKTFEHAMRALELSLQETGAEKLAFMKARRYARDDASQDRLTHYICTQSIDSWVDEAVDFRNKFVRRVIIDPNITSSLAVVKRALDLASFKVPRARRAATLNALKERGVQIIGPEGDAEAFQAWCAKRGF